ncbi:N-formylglutamate amidohydrolase [Marinicauda sp. Alg238-R41]|uniref:N-formylglutamate amidohydrolase n=1 Tax=Marinicauda sp. Alg238-R41 TaxID=2993447 RepID=UPI0022E87042|nr:N-formylglutamate amidohydrolase [Marinicauda sp. Alg238-R41]
MSASSSPSSSSSNPVRIDRPRVRSSRFVFASPHSGRDYTADFLARAALPVSLLRRSEDAYLDQLFEAVPRYGASLVAATFPRAFVDPNRARWELDPAMFDRRLPSEAGPVTARAAAGLGVVPRLAADGRAIYAGRISLDEALERVRRHYDPYHAALKQEIAIVRDQFGEAVVIDCHSMPSGSARGADIVLGDRFGVSCAPGLVEHAEQAFRRVGLGVVRNRPYAGGYTTEYYGRPDAGVHVLQVEINRALYLDESRVERSAKWPRLAAALDKWAQDIMSYGEATRAAAE